MGMLVGPHMVSSRLSAYGIKHAALFDGVSGYLSRIPVDVGNRLVWTWSGWLARCDESGTSPIYSAGNTDLTCAVLEADYKIRTYWNGPTGGTPSDGVYRDTTGFVHVALVVNGSTFKVYINNREVSSKAMGADGAINSSVEHRIASWTYAAGFNHCYLGDVYFVDGQALTPDAFGKVDTKTGNWVAKKYTGTYGTNGFYLDFSNASALGDDASGNANHWTVNGTVTQVTSTPTKVKSIFSPLSADVYTDVRNGGTQAYHTNSAGVGGVVTSLAAENQKFYFEAEFNTSGTYPFVGVADLTHITRVVSGTGTGSIYGSAHAWTVQANGLKRNNNVTAAYGSAITTQRIGVGVDGVNGAIWVALNGTWQAGATLAEIESGNLVNAMFTGLAGRLAPAVCGGVSGEYVNLYVGEDEWLHTCPSGFVALTSDNLPKVSDDVSKHFSAKLYTGTGAVQVVSGFRFQPSFAWLKGRSFAINNMIYDAVRGAENRLCSDGTFAEAAQTGTLTGFAADGFNLGADAQVNSSGQTFVSWCANLPQTTNPTGGTITPTGYRGNPALGMAVVTFTGNGVSGATLPHGLGVKPGVILIKRLDTTGNWTVYHAALGGTKCLFLEQGAAALTNSTLWNDTDPTSTVLSLGSSASVNASGGTYVAYIFAESDFIKIGSYTGNGSADGPFLNTGSSPVWGLFKTHTTTGSWEIHDDVRDPFNPVEKYLYADLTNAEAVAVNNKMDFTANGVKLRGPANDINGSGLGYVYMIIGQPNGPTENPAR